MPPSPIFDRTSVATYTEDVLKWWRTNGSGFKQWACAARVVFAISPNSAACERVLSLLKLMFGDEQLSILADAIHPRRPHASCFATTTGSLVDVRVCTHVHMRCDIDRPRTHAHSESHNVYRRNFREISGKSASICEEIVSGNLR